MQTVLPGEDGRQRQDRAGREEQVREAEIKRRAELDQSTSEAAGVAGAQIANKNSRRPLDYAAILRCRPLAPGLFTLLPSDEACRVALGITDAKFAAGEPLRETLKLKK